MGGGQTGRRSGRRAGDSGTREAILRAARGRFAEHGYEGATIRAIAADAGVDPALVHHFYGSKERLFAAAMRLPVIPSEVLTAALAPEARAPGMSLGEHMVRTALGVWESTTVFPSFLGLLRSAVTSEKAAAMLREFMVDSILRPIARAAAAPDSAGHGDSAGPEDADYRAAMAATQMLGLALARYVLALPAVAGASTDDLAAVIGPTLDRYLTGEIRPPGAGAHSPGGTHPHPPGGRGS
ncbi:MAG TPA: TetR family transcriptional regulator [Streptosporangiaceae bacterium]